MAANAPRLGFTSRLIRELRENTLPSQGAKARFELQDFENDNHVAAVTQALKANTAFDKFVFSFRISSTQDGDLVLNWNPLVEAIATHEKLRQVTIAGFPTGRHLRFFSDQLFPALQRNSNLQSLELYLEIDAALAAPIVSFLDHSMPNLTNLTVRTYENRGTSDHAARNIAAALQRNVGLRSLNLICDVPLVLPVLQSLASSDSDSCLRTLTYYHRSYSNSIAEALQQYLESPNVAIQRFEICEFGFWHQLMGPKILLGLARNATIHELAFVRCTIRNQPGHEQFLDEELQCARHLASLIRSKRGLQSLSFGCATDFLYFQEVTDAVVYLLRLHDSQLRDFDLDATNLPRPLPLPLFRTLMYAAAGSTRLNRLRVQISCNQADHLQAVVESLPSLRDTEFTLVLLGIVTVSSSTQTYLLNALKNNYIIQRMQCNAKRSTSERETNGLSEPNRARLDFYLNRNCKLAEWTENPKLVPHELWSYAMMLALKAGINSLYQSLMALSGQGIGLRQQGRKRKCPQ